MAWPSWLALHHQLPHEVPRVLARPHPPPALLGIRARTLVSRPRRTYARGHAIADSRAPGQESGPKARPLAPGGGHDSVPPAEPSRRRFSLSETDLDLRGPGRRRKEPPGLPTARAA